MQLTPEGRALASELLTRCTFPASGTAVDCAVSGGADSMALLMLAASNGCDVTAWHVDHGLRDGSDAEFQAVEELTLRLGAKFEGRTVKVEPGANVEARARSARRAVLPKNVFTGHTADDQAETVLINLMRGAGIEGLAGMRTDTKPILGLRRSETELLCRVNGVDPFHDPSNEDMSIVRNRVRKQLLPLMDDVMQRDVREIVARQTAVLREHSDLLDQLSADVDPSDAKTLASSPKALAKHALRNWLRAQLDDELHPPDQATVERAMRVVNGEVRACELPGGRRLERSAQRLRIVDR